MTVTELSPADTAHLRRVFAAHPSGVTAVAGLVDGRPHGLAASSFTSVSLDPPLVSVCIGRSSTTWPRLRTAPRIGVSVLGAHQAEAGRTLSSSGVDRFADIAWRSSADGAVFVEGAAAWLETVVENVFPAGDHEIILLRVLDLDVDESVAPLVFHSSGFRNLAG